jgi:NADH-quinone oxidoreductase subunit G
MANDNVKLVTVTIDDTTVQVPAGTLVTDAAQVAGIEIPVFCYHPKLTPVGMCRMCLGEVGLPSRSRETGQIEVDEYGKPVIRFLPKLQATCTTEVSDGMVIRTKSEVVKVSRQAVLEFILSSHPLDCPVCDKGGECPLQDLTYSYGPGRSRFDYEDKFHFEKPIPLGPLVALDRERCIQCARCTRFQDEIAGDPVLGFEHRSRGIEIVTYSDPPFNSKFSGNTTDICPVGALTSRDFRFRGRVWELTDTRSICPYCAVGCNIIVGHRAGQIRRIMPRENNAVNEIWICDKGRFGHHFVNSPDRLTTPLVRKDGELVAVAWPEALELVADRLRALRDQHGPDALGGISGDRVANEDLYVFQRFVRTVMGTNNVDHWRQPRELAGNDLIAQVGMGSGTNLMDLGAGDALLVVGADVEEETPILFLRMKQASKQGAYLVVANGRPTKLARYANDDLMIPYGSETHFVLGLLKAVLEGNLVKSDFVSQRTSGIDKLKAGLTNFDLASLAETAGVSVDDLRRIAKALTEAGNLIVSFGRDAMITGGGRALMQALANLLIVAGHVGHANNGLLPLLPHNNSQGAADMGMCPTWLPGYQRVDDADVRRRFGEVWGVEPPASSGLDAEAMIGNTRGLFIMGADPVGDRPDLREVFEKLDLLVVHELFLTETARLADVVLPAAAFAERDGTFTNTERRVQRLWKGFDPPGEAKPDWDSLTDLAHLMGARFAYANAEGVMDEIAEVVPIYAGLQYHHLSAQMPTGIRTRPHFVYEGTSFVNPQDEGRRWPVRAEDPDARLEIVWLAPPERPAPNADFPLLVVPHKRLYDDGTLIERSRILEVWVPTPLVYLNQADAKALGVADGQSVNVVSSAGQLALTARVNGQVPAGVALVPQGLEGANVSELGLADGVVWARVEVRSGPHPPAPSPNAGRGGDATPLP